MADTNLVPLKSIMVVRENKRVSPPIGKGFPFTADEVKALKEGTDYRKPVNEDEQADLASILPERNSPHIGPKTNAQGAGNTTTMTNGADGAPATGQSGQNADANENADQRLAGNATDTIALVGGLDDKADLVALRAAEASGSNRSTVIKAIDARVAALTTDDDL